MGERWGALSGIGKYLEGLLGSANPESEPPHRGPRGPYTPSPSGGRGGDLSDAKNLTWDSGKRSSVYHRKASHLSGPGPWPLVIHLHGDGHEEVTAYGEEDAPSVGYGYEAAAVQAGALFVMPCTPDEKHQTWYDRNSSTKWLAAFVKMLQGSYNVDRRRIFFSGYSGGAEEVTYNLACDHHTLFEGGGAMLLGGGGAEELTGFTGEPSEAVKRDFLLRWWTGEADNGRPPSDPSIDAVAASEEGRDWYAAAGFDTRRNVLPGVDHYTSEPYGPDLLAALIRESDAHYGIER